MQVVHGAVAVVVVVDVPSPSLSMSSPSQVRSPSMSAGVEALSSGSLVDSYPEYACSPAQAEASSTSEYPSSSSSRSSVSPSEL